MLLDNNHRNGAHIWYLFNLENGNNMKPIYISGESLQGNSYKLFMSFLLDKSNIFSYETLKMSDAFYDAEDKKYFENILMTERIFNNFYKKKNIDERNNLKSFVYLNNPIVKEHLKSAESIYHWNYPDGIENLCFYKNDICFFESITHENYFAFYPENQTEIDKLKNFGIIFLI